MMIRSGKRKGKKNAFPIPLKELQNTPLSPIEGDWGVFDIRLALEHPNSKFDVGH